MSTLLEDLQRPFDSADVEWRVGRSGKTDKGFWAYITNRAIMNRLDQVVGPENWRNEFKDWQSGGVLCGISLLVDHGNNYKEWVTKWDGASNTDIESVKGGLSDAMKRCAVQWGIGRYLYNLEEAFVKCSPEKKNGWNYAKTKEGGVFFWETPTLPSWALPEKLTKTPEPTAQPKPQQETALSAKDSAAESGGFADPSEEQVKLYDQAVLSMQNCKTLKQLQSSWELIYPKTKDGTFTKRQCLGLESNKDAFKAKIDSLAKKTATTAG